ncbi:hypothetical protein H072_9897 [Dactylellina haptotyla CBS 200.50]|uniref:Inhibitor I9 domain-containing protein n=1 Tax=Dactylellina haptotyla (strain CBS 200.50) TaxID=1284197 RepID=S8BN28_DACHA|nr:hypothetical protein H072_9897 [Dactylellina haptotyla CBS 200.50]
MAKRYIVKLKQDADREIAKQHIIEGTGGGATIVSELNLLNAIIVEIPDGYMGALESAPDVEFVEEDQIITTQEVESLNI